MDKFKHFELTLQDGTKVTAKAQLKVTVGYALNIAYHWAKVRKEDVISIKGIK